MISVKNCHANWSKMAYQYGYINIKNLDNTSIISNFALMKNFAAIEIAAHSHSLIFHEALRGIPPWNDAGLLFQKFYHHAPDHTSD